ncbi:hypothetical protein [Cupriavidus pinatubonensis]|uniref:hypothetical protein n=1 Tax=Cupriavidus pinatubonensis TaxID=248026 RepID=UPI00360965C9
MLRILYPLFLIEAVIGGGGRMAGFAPVSVRWIVAALCLAVTALHLIVRGLRIPVTSVSLVMAYSWMLCAGTVVGLLKGNDTAQIVADVGQLSYFFIFPFVFHYFQVESRARRTTERFFVYPAVVLSIVYFFALYLIFGQGRFEQIYEILSIGDDFFFREDQTFFYKSFLYLGVACFFLVEHRTPGRLLALCLILVAIYLTHTRGLYLSVILIIALVYTNFKQKFSLFLVLLAVSFILSAGEIIQLAAKPDSDVVRLLDLQYIYQHTDVKSLLLGHGFGASINDRGRIEIAWAEIFFKQGLLGLGVWLYWLCQIVNMYYAFNDQKRKLLRPYFSTTLFVMVISFTNPFMNNSIGLVALLVSYFAIQQAAMGYDGATTQTNPAGKGEMS